MSIFADLRELISVLQDVDSLEKGPVQIDISAPVKITITAADGKVILDTTVNINVPTEEKPDG